VTRLLPVAGLVVASVGLAGCASTVDTLTSRKFRQRPFEALFNPGDPLTVMRTSPEGDERAAAMRRLKEPVLSGRPQEEQDEAVQLLTTAATSDPSPVVRVAAVDALGRFQDERAVGVLTAAYHQAAGVAAKPKVVQAGFGGADRLSLAGPVGFAPEMVTVIRTRVVESLAQTGRAEAVPVLTRVATGQDEDGPDPDRDVRLAAVRGLAKLRVPESAVALARVLADEKGKDPALAGRAHEGLVSLTGQPHPADPEQWNAVVQAGVTIAPEPDAVQRAVDWVAKP
jgi:HEAT repeat protein